MKTKFRLLALFALVSLFGNRAHSQSSTTYFHKNGPGWWTLGIDGGMAYQSSDILSTWNGWGGGMTLGKNLAYRPGGIVSFDLRGRRLLDRSFGASHRRSTGILKNDALNGSRAGNPNYLLDTDGTKDSSFVFANNRTTMFEGGIEGVLTLNRLREKTGVVVNFFGGIGLDWYNTRTDQAGANGDIYLDKYLTVNQFASRRSNLAALRSLRDGSYETHADGFGNGIGKLGIMPGLGVEVGFQVTPRFVIGLGHKATFSRTDILDGQQSTNSNAATARNDIAHYTNLHLRWDLEPAKKRERAPEITITDPGGNPHESVSSNLFVRATIKNVRSAVDVNARLNGREIPFRFGNSKFGASLPLQPGRNELVIHASNLTGDDSETLLVFYKNPNVPPYFPPAPPPPAPPTTRLRPEVQFTNPARSPYQTERDEVFVTATVKNVNSKRDLRFFVNGKEEARFSFAEGFEANVRLGEGRNVLRLEAENGNGSASDEVIINVDKPAPPSPQKPKVSISEPTNGRKFSVKNVTLVGRAEAVADRSKISVTVNNQPVRDFEFDKTNGEIRADIELAAGENGLKISATNAHGADEASVRVTYSGLKTPPSVSILSPKNGASTEQNRAEVEATVSNVAQNSGIEFLVNGISGTRFQFSNGKLTATASLRDGENTITVRGTNADGADEKSVKIRLEKIKRPPVVSFVSPKNGTETDKNEAAIEANISNLASSSGASLSVNGIKTTRFQFADGKLTGQVALREGENTISVRGTNDDGSDEKSIRIAFKRAKVEPVPAPILEPAVQFNYPAKPGVKTVKTTETLTFSTQNVQNANQIKVTTGRGTTVVGVKFDPRTGTGSIEAQLSKGSNNFQITAATKDGTASAETKIILSTDKTEPARPKPAVEITSASPPIENTSTVLAKTMGIATRASVTITANGAYLTNFTFDEKTGGLKVTVPLVRGENKVVIRVSSGRDSAEAERVIRY